MTAHPATVVVHTPTKAEPCCSHHAQVLGRLMAFMGAHCTTQPAEAGAECGNCRNEAATHQRLTEDCACFAGLCRGGQVVNGKLPNGQRCREAG